MSSRILTRSEIQQLAATTVANEGLLLARELERGEMYDGHNLAALLEIFADKLDAAKSTDVVAVIDARLGAGWTRRLAEAMK